MLELHSSCLHLLKRSHECAHRLLFSPTRLSAELSIHTARLQAGSDHTTDTPVTCRQLCGVLTRCGQVLPAGCSFVHALFVFMQLRTTEKIMQAVPAGCYALTCCQCPVQT